MEHSEIKDIVIKYLLNEATPEEKKAVLQWIQDADQNKADFLELQGLVDSILASTNPYKLDSDEAYKKIRQKLKTNKSEPESSGNHSLSFFLRIAAIFVLGFGLSWLLHDGLNKKTGIVEIAGYQKVIVPYGSKTKLELPDGTRVTLNSGSTLKYPVQFGGKTRNVYLDGEAYFDVKKDKTRPFFVNTSGIHIKVLGTSFNVKSYPEEKTVETTLITGSVQIFSDKDSRSAESPVLLKPNQKAVYIKSSGLLSDNTRPDIPKDDTKPKIEPIHVESVVKTEPLTAWKDNRLEFDNELFRDVIVKMERWYNVEITMNTAALYKARFSGKFDKENVEQAMKALVVVTPFHYEINKNKITIY
jgi:ferric-dicitrate binding protein FerR (iron transport regulator)